MTVRTHTFEQQTTGATVTTTGSLWDTVTIPGGSTMTIDTTHAMHGSKSCKIVPASAQNPNLRDNVSTSAFNAVFYVWFDSLPSADLYLYRALVGSTRVLSVHIASGPGGKLRLSEAGSTTGVWTAAATLPLSQWVRIEVYGVVGSTTSNGTASIGVYLGDSTTPIETVYSSTARNLGTSPVTIQEFGKGSTDTYTTAFWFDSVQHNDAATGLPGPYSPPANQAPVVTPPAAQMKATGQTATLTMTAVDPEGDTITAYSWTATSWPSGASAPTLTGGSTISATTSALTVPGIYTFTPTATDSGSHTGTGAVATVYVYAADGTAAIRAKRGATWTGGTPADLNDASDSTYGESPSAPVNSAQIWDADPIGPGDAAITVRLRMQPTGGAATTCTVEILSGSGDAVVATRSNVALTDSWVNTVVTLTSGENTAFSNRGLWAIKLTANQ